MATELAAPPAETPAPAAPTAPAPTPAPAAAAPAAPAPEFSVKLPEGFSLDEKLMGEFSESAKALKLDSAGGQKFVDLHVKAMKMQAEAQAAAQEKEHKGWQEALKADKEFGGDKFAASNLAARKAVAKFGDASLNELFASQPWGDHPALAKFIIRVGMSLAEDSVAGSASPPPAPAPKSVAERMYPDMFSKEK